MSTEKDYTKIPVTLNVTLNDAMILAQLAAKLPIEQGLPLFEYLKDTLSPILEQLQKEKKDEGTNEDDTNTSAD